MRRIAILLALTLIAGILAGCTKTPAPEHTTNAAQASTQAAPQTAPASTDEPAGPDDTAAPVFRFTRENFPRMDGSTACIPLAEAVASVLLGESREQAADLVHFNRTTQSFRNLKDGLCDILIVGQPKASVFDEMKEAGFEYEIETLARDGLVFVVNENNPVNSLTTEQIRKIYTGEITNWNEVGGNDGEIVLIGREAGSGTRDGFESITGTEDACKYRQELTSTGDVITTVAGNPNAIGYASLASVKNSVKAISVGGVAPSEATIKDGSYAVQRPFVLVTKTDAELSETAKKFFDYITSADANEIITSAGVVPAN